MTGKTSDHSLCPYSDPALCRLCSHECNARELADLVEKLEAATVRVGAALEGARRRLLSLRDDAAGDASPESS